MSLLFRIPPAPAPTFAGTLTLTSIPVGQWYSAAFAGGNITTINLSTGARNTFVTSTGTNGTAYASALPNIGNGINAFWNGTSSGNGIMMSVSQTGYSTTSADGITWSTPVLLGSGAQLRGCGYGNGRWIAVGVSNNAWYSDDSGATWTAMSLPTGATIHQSVMYANGLWVIATSSLYVLTSPDGINWTKRTTGDGTWSVAYGNGVYVATGRTTNDTFTSTDGINWTTHTSALPGGSFWYTVVYGNGKFVAIDGNLNNVQGIMHSADGVTWTRVTGTAGRGYRSIAYGNGKFVAFGGAEMALIV